MIDDAKQLAVSVYRTDTHLIITGQPEDESHNCRAMRCAGEHVLYRIPLPQLHLFHCYHCGKERPVQEQSSIASALCQSCADAANPALHPELYTDEERKKGYPALQKTRGRQES